jgi:hypothetical protein
MYGIGRRLVTIWNEKRNTAFHESRDPLYENLDRVINPACFRGGCGRLFRAPSSVPSRSFIHFTWRPQVYDELEQNRLQAAMSKEVPPRSSAAQIRRPIVSTDRFLTRGTVLGGFRRGACELILTGSRSPGFNGTDTRRLPPLSSWHCSTVVSVGEPSGVTAGTCTQMLWRHFLLEARPACLSNSTGVMPRPCEPVQSRGTRCKNQVQDGTPPRNSR